MWKIKWWDQNVSNMSVCYRGLPEALSRLSGEIIFFIADVDIICVSVCVCLYFVTLFVVLRWIPRCFTIGEAMVVTQAVVLVAVDSYTNLGIKVNIHF